MFKDNFLKKIYWEEPNWITSMSVEDFENNCNCEQGRGNVYIPEDTNHGLYSKVSPQINGIDYHYRSNIYLKHVNPNLINIGEHGSTYRPLHKRSMIKFNKESCGWGREVRLHTYPENNYNNYFKLVNRRWFEFKILEKLKSGMDLHKFSFNLDSIHSLACFWVCEYGLWRRSPEYTIDSFVFQDLNYQQGW